MRSAEELRYAILALQREGNRVLATALKPIGVTPSQAEVLRVLDERGPLTLAGLGELLLCETGTGPSRLVDRLVVQRYVIRTEDATDRRSVRLTLSPAGHEISARVARVEEELYATMDALTADYPTVEALTLLRGMLSAFPSGAVLDRRAGRLLPGVSG